MVGWSLPEAVGGRSSARPCWMSLQEQGMKADGFQRASAFGSVHWRRLGLGLFGLLHLCCLLCLMTCFSDPLGMLGVL